MSAPTYVPVQTTHTVYSVINNVLNWYEDLVKANVKFGVVMVIACSEKPPLKLLGCKAKGLTKIVPSKDRCIKGYDVELLIDDEEWRGGEDKHHAALIDHLLAQVEVRKKKPARPKKGMQQNTQSNTQPVVEFATDQHGRPALKMKPKDWSSIGFADVVKRHQAFSIEYLAERAHDYVIKKSG